MVNYFSIRLLWLWIVTMTFACSWSQLLLAADSPPKYALLIAVTKYNDAGMNSPQLLYPEEDAKAVGAFLEQHGYKCDYLIGTQATKANIDAKLEAMSGKSNQDGVGLLGLWGHGIELDSGEAMFCPFDTTMKIAKDADGKTLYSANTQTPLLEPKPESLVGMSRLLEGLTVCGAGNRLLIADCCRVKPNAARGRGAFGSRVTAADLPPGTAAIFACAAEQKAFEHDSWKHGAFTKALLDELPQLAGRSNASVTDIIGPVSNSVLTMVSTITSGRDRQNIQPIFNGLPNLKLESKTAPATYINSAGGKMVLLPAGTFMMGSPEADSEADFDEKPQHRVTLSRLFYMGETEVTQGQWKAVMGTEPWKGKSYVKEDAKYPATYLSWEDAVEYCRRLSQREGHVYRLPTEAEWEYACRGGKSTTYSFGDHPARLGRYGWFDANSDKTGDDYAHEVKQKFANPYELYDMHGNVWEWCKDRYGKYSSGASVDPEGPTNGEYRVIRGGSWRSTAGLCLSANRRRYAQSLRFIDLGFRLVSVRQ